MRRLKVVLGDLNYLNRHTHRTTLIPLNIGYMASYINTKFPNQLDISLHKDPDNFIEDIKDTPPDIIGLSFYYWNTNLNKVVTEYVRSLYGSKTIIVWGGPSVDSDTRELGKLFTRFPLVDSFVVNEGELGFANIIEAALSNRQNMWKAEIDGVAFLKNNNFAIGKPVGLTLDLAELPSPYLSGFLDPFLKGDYLPILQTSRLCPYTCAFCVSGKNRGKLRAFDNEMVKEEMNYVFKHFVEKSHYRLYLADENFGVLKRDIEIAEHLLWCSENIGYPKSIFFYNDKRFTETSRKIQEILAPLSTHGVALALQTDNPEALKAINRVNLTKTQIESAIDWAANKDYYITTELIFGLPLETRDSFIKTLNDSVSVGFDSVVCHNLFIVDGIELNRPEERKKFDLKTKYRPLSTNYGMINGKFSFETEEVVVSNSSFNFQEYLEIRWLNLFFYTIFSIGWYRDFFQHVRRCNIPVASFLSKLIDPSNRITFSKAHNKFIDDFENVVKGELHETRELVEKKLKKLYLENNNDVAQPARYNVFYGSRLCYFEKEWAKDILFKIFKTMTTNEEDLILAKQLIEIGSVERVNLIDPKIPSSLDINYDLISWRKDKYRNPIQKYKVLKNSVQFYIKPELEPKRKDFLNEFSDFSENEFYYAALDYINPRTDLLFGIRGD